jgi:hypothetical protein
MPVQQMQSVAAQGGFPQQQMMKRTISNSQAASQTQSNTESLWIQDVLSAITQV